ncbi:MAG TPA: cytochrome b [Dyella sp.]|uniref:cytochrome b n=1 Tax=Dyella sp. TaxID=1869338 RepID=UPI002F959856
MNLRSTERQWGAVAKFFHWLMALVILGNGIFGLCMDLASSPMQKIGWFALHKSIGLTVLALFLLRLMWRLADRRPRDEPGPRWQHLAAHAVHGVLYVLILAMPLSGWWFNSLRGFPLQYFKQFNLPAIAEKNEELARTVLALHEYLFYILLLVLVAHVGAALKHHIFDNDNVLRRMLPFGKLRGTPSQGDS